jgi:hypothetical protein
MLIDINEPIFQFFAKPISGDRFHARFWDSAIASSLSSDETNIIRLI